MQDALNKPPLDKPSTKAIPLVESDEDEDDDDLYRFVDTLENKSNGPLKPKPQPARVFNPAEDYNLW